jgi:hypothetical protein
MQINKKISQTNSRNTNFKYIAMVAVIAATLVRTTAITADSTLATKYDRNQANACGNGELQLNVGCQNIDSQIQGDENAVSRSRTGIPRIRSRRPGTRLIIQQIHLIFFDFVKDKNSSSSYT